MRVARIGILTISDRASRGIHEDLGGPAIPYCIDLIEGAWLEADPAACAAFRPAHAKKSAETGPQR